MVKTKDLPAFIRMQEYKLQAKIYARKYEKLAALLDDDEDEEEEKLMNGERSYHYQPGDSIWLDRGSMGALPPSETDDALSAYELKFLH